MVIGQERLSVLAGPVFGNEGKAKCPCPQMGLFIYYSKGEESLSSIFLTGPSTYGVRVHMGLCLIKQVDNLCGSTHRLRRVSKETLCKVLLLLQTNFQGIRPNPYIP